MPKPLDAIIIGAGISGLTAAYSLQKKGQSVKVLEVEDRPGGLIQSEFKDGFLIEHGPNTIDASNLNLIEELNLKEEILDTHPGAPHHFSVLNGKLVPMPRSLRQFIFSPIFSLSSKLSILTEILKPRKKNKLDESIAHFIKRRFNQEVLDRAVDPLISGIFAGDPEKLSAKYTFKRLFEAEQNHGSITWGMIKSKKKGAKRRSISFKDGIQTLTDALAQTIEGNIDLNCIHKSITQKDAGWIAQGTTSGQPFSYQAKQLIIAIPAHELSTLPFSAEINAKLNPLSTITYAPMAVITLGFNRADIAHPLNGFGYLIPKRENRKTLGTIFNSSLFPKRSSTDKVLLTSFIGGSRRHDLFNTSDETLLSIALHDLRDLIGLTGEPTFINIHRWKNAIPQYAIGYEKYLDAMDAIETEYPNLKLLGNYRGGVGVPNCIENAQALSNACQ